MNIAVLLGGTTAEREVSLASGLAVINALREKGHDVVAVDTARGYVARDQESQLLPEGVHAAPPGALDDVLEPVAIGEIPELRQADLAFLTLHGGIGEDGTLQTLLALNGIRYTGTGPLGSGIAMDKDISKRLLRDAEIMTPPWRIARAPDFAYDADAIGEAVGYPCIVKPSRQGSSVGLTTVEAEDGLDAAIREAAKFDTEVMIERFVRGRELTVSIVGEEALPVVEIRPKKGIYDYESKYTAGMTEYLCPAPIESSVAADAQRYAVRAFNVLKLHGYARIDFMFADSHLFCLEANTLPGMTATSLLPKAAAAAGMSFPDLCDRIAQLAFADRHAAS